MEREHLCAQWPITNDIKSVKITRQKEMILGTKTTHAFTKRTKHDEFWIC